MKSYFAASAVAALACVYVVVAAEAPVPATAAAPAAVAAWPAAATAMARLSQSRWLLRAMSAAGCAGTLASTPCDLPAETQPL